MAELLHTRAGGSPRLPAGPRARRRPSSWLLPLGLILLAVVPMIGGTVRLVELAGDVQITPDNDHVTITTPVPIVLHIISAVLFTMVGALQFSTGLRRRRPGLHRASGRLLVPIGLVAAGSALWMTISYPQPTGSGDLLYVARLVFASGMAAALVVGLVEIRRRHVQQHRAWMTRAYAIGLGAGTQALTLGFGEALLGDAPLVHDLLMTAAWVINLAIAEWAIRRPARPARPARIVASRP